MTIVSAKDELMQTVHCMIKENSGKIRSCDLDRMIGNKQDVRFAISRLTVMGLIRRVRGFGKSGIEYFYHDTEAQPFRNHSKMQRRLFTSARTQVKST